ncbi:MAG: class I SAM-dependent methyltransferase [Candidatus Krumholzibacteriia bacterium]
MAERLNLREWFGGIDIYLFDQLLKGRFDESATILDAGCGDGRNLVYFMRSGFEVFAIDGDERVVGSVRAMAARIAPRLPAGNFRVADVGEIPFEDLRFDVVISTAVLHFAADKDHFDRMLDSMWRVLKNNGVLFARLASTIGMEDRVQHIGGRRYRLPDGSERFLVDEPMLRRHAKRLGADLLEPIKTTNVHDKRCMTTWCLRKTG